MAQIQSGDIPSNIAIVDPTFKALRASIQTEEGVGHYRMVAASGSLAFNTAAGNLFSFRYNGFGTCLIRRIGCGVFQTAATDVAGSIRLDSYVVRNFVTMGTTNATAINLDNTNGKLRRNYASSLSRAYVCTTATITGDIGPNGTGVPSSTNGEDATPIGSVVLDIPVAITTSPPGRQLTTTAPRVNQDLSPLGTVDILPLNSIMSPQVLYNNEGFRIKSMNPTPGSTTGAYTFLFLVEWTESRSLDSF